MKLEKRMVTEYGVTLDGVWIPHSVLEELDNCDGMEGFMPGVAAVDSDQERALITAGLAHRSTRGSLFPNSDAYRKFMRELEA